MVILIFFVLFDVTFLLNAELFAYLYNHIRANEHLLTNIWFVQKIREIILMLIDEFQCSVLKIRKKVLIS